MTDPTDLADTVVKNGTVLHAPTLACRPVRLEDYPPDRLAMYERVVAESGQNPTIYPGSTYQSCKDCGIEVALGPHGQELIPMAAEFGLNAHVVCFICAAQRAGNQAKAGEDVGVMHMGNPFKKKA